MPPSLLSASGATLPWLRSTSASTARAGSTPACRPTVLAAALDGLDADLRRALERAADQVRWFHERARPGRLVRRA